MVRPAGVFCRAREVSKIMIFSKARARAVAPNKNRFFSATLARALSRRLSRGAFVACVPPKKGGN